MRVERPVAPLGTWASGALIALLLTGVLWAYAQWSGWGGLEVDEHCGQVLGEPLDADFRYEHSSQTRWPFSSPCNAGYDMVPGWVNPAIAVSALAFLVCAGIVVVLSAVEVLHWWRVRTATSARDAGSRSAGVSR